MAMVVDRRHTNMRLPAFCERGRCRNHCGRHCHCRWWLAAMQLGRINGGDRAGSLRWNWPSLKADVRVHKKYRRNSRSTGEAESKQSAPGVARLD